MPATLTTDITELPDSRVRVRVQVPPKELEARIDRKARELGRGMRLPGFRRGKVPAPLVIQRVGREALLEEAVHDALSGWYATAIDTAGIVPVGDPKLDVGDLPDKGGALEFSIEVGVVPSARLGEYKGLEVGRREPVIAQDAVQGEIDALRERLARLQSVDRPAESGDFVVVDYVGSIDGESFAGGEGRDQLVELGSGNLIPGFEEGLQGASAGESRTVPLTFPSDYPNEQLAGCDASFEITVKDVKHKQLPEMDDDFAVDIGFDSVEELTADIRSRIAEIEDRRVDGEFREAALDAAVAHAEIDTPQVLVEAKAQEMWQRMLHSLSHRGISSEAYLKITGRTEEELVSELLPEAEQSLRREAVIAAVIAAEGIAPTDEELLEVLAPTAEREGVDPSKLMGDLRRSGRLEDVRDDLAARQVVELIASHAKAIPIEQAQAREKLWTPEDDLGDRGEQEDVPARLWTPDR